MTKNFIIGLLCFCLTFFSATSSLAGLVTLEEMHQRSRAQAPLQQRLLEQLERPESQEQLAKYGITKEEARARLAAMNEQELKDFIQSKNLNQAGGDIGIVTVLLIIIIVILIR
ncbi:PA2779 family protein [Bdellovibrio bacteriovorus]